MMNIVYYITGHGLGHVTRSIVMINYLICSNNNHKLYIVSALDESLFIKILCNDCNLPEDKVRKSITFYKRDTRFGGHKVDCFPDDWVCLVLGSKTEEMPSKKFIAVSFDCYIPDLLIMADCFLGKVGYGFVSECLTANCPLIYISRSHWAEESYLVTLLDSYNAGLEMPIKLFQSGN